MTPPNLRDHVPAILDLLSDAVDRREEGPRPLEDLPEQHAALRFHEGYDLRQVVAEYRLLRHVITDLYTERGNLSGDVRSKMKPLTVMHQAVDRAISEAVDQYAAERERVRDRFIAVLGHDLRDPLNIVVFSANALLARSNTLEATTVKTAAHLATAAKRMERMIADLLDFARGRRGGGFSVVPTRFDARMLVGHSVQEIAHAHPDRDVRCLTEHASGNFDVEWDGDRIGQVVANLVGNALVHGHDPVVINIADEGGEVAIGVSNRGGIPADVLPRLFDPFVSDAPDTARRGLGLGLYIAQQIVYAHGGTVRAASSNGTTTMIVTLPRRARAMSLRASASPDTVRRDGDSSV